MGAGASPLDASYALKYVCAKALDVHMVKAAMLLIVRSFLNIKKTRNVIKYHELISKNITKSIVLSKKPFLIQKSERKGVY